MHPKFDIRGLAGACALAALTSAATAGAFVTTNHDDYPPNATVWITGGGFLPLETVELRVVHADGTPPDGAGHDPWQVAADANGGFHTSWIVCADDCLGSMLELRAEGLTSTSLATAQFLDSGGDFAVDFTAAAPGTYTHATGGGAYNDRTVGVNADVVEQLNGGDFLCGDLVTFLVHVEHVGPTGTDDPQTVELGFEFALDSSGMPGVGYDDVVNVAVNYGAVENGDGGTPPGGGVGVFDTDSGIVDDGGSTATIVSETMNATDLMLTITVDDLEMGESVIVRIDVRLACVPNSTPTGTLQARQTSRRVVAINGDTPADDPFGGMAAMTIPLMGVDDIMPVGACCLLDGTCVETTPDDCTAQQGTYQGDGTTCATTDCVGACCLPGGTCIDTTLADCTAQQGTYQGFGTTCATTDCVGACCLPDGTCIETTLDVCTGQQGVYQGFGTLCADTRCAAACCLPDGTCIVATLADCTAQNGAYQGFGTMCADVDCPGACCLPDGTCVETSLADCTAQNGAYQGFGTMCAVVDCPGACCLPDGTCVETTLADCTAQNGAYQGFGTMCAVVDCPGACCLPDGTCVETTLADCTAQQGAYQGFGTMCADVVCPQPFERGHPGWNWVDNGITLTANQPTYWSALTGTPGPNGAALSPLTVLDPGMPPGRPDPDGTTDRVLRGFVVAWAVDAMTGEEIRWNHLSGAATTIDYRAGRAWEYGAFAHPAVAPVETGERTGTPGVLNLDGVEYVPAFDQLVFPFQATGTGAWSGANVQVDGDTDLTIMPVSLDLRQETDGPVTTKASYDVWNENEVKFSGADRCVTCWDRTLLSAFGDPSHFTLATLQTAHGHARIDGVASQLCDVDVDPTDGPLGADPRDVISRPDALLGVAAKLLRFDGQPTAAAGVPLAGMGTQSAVIRYDTVGGPSELAGGDAAPRHEGDAVVEIIDRIVRRVRGEAPVEPALGPSTGDRVDASSKGSLLIFPRVEVRWDAMGNPVQDTFIVLSNDYPGEVRVLLYFVNGDPPLPAAP